MGYICNHLYAVQPTSAKVATFGSTKSHVRHPVGRVYQTSAMRGCTLPWGCRLARTLTCAVHEYDYVDVYGGCIWFYLLCMFVVNERSK